MGLTLVRRQLDRTNKVGRVASGGQGSGSSQCLVDRTLVNATLRLLSVDRWYEPNDGHVRVELFGLGLAKQLGFVVPAGALNVESSNVAPGLGHFLYLILCFANHLLVFVF